MEVKTASGEYGSDGTERGVGLQVSMEMMVLREEAAYIQVKVKTAPGEWR